MTARIQTNFLNPAELHPDTNTLANLADELRRPENFLKRTVDVMTDRVNEIIEDAIHRKNENLTIDHDLRATLWKIAGWATIVATIAITVGAMVAAGFFSPVYVPIVPIVSYLLWQTVLEKASHYCFENAKNSESTFDYKKKIKQIYDDGYLSNYSPAELETKIRVELNQYFGLESREEIDPELGDVLTQHDLRPVLAEYLYSKSEIQRLAVRSAELDRQAIDQVAVLQNSHGADLELNQDALRKTLEDMEAIRNEHAAEIVRFAKYLSVLAQPRQSTHFDEEIQIYRGGTPLNQLGREALHRFRPRAAAIFDLYPNRTDTLILPAPEQCLTRLELERLHPALLARLLTKAFN